MTAPFKGHGPSAGELAGGLAGAIEQLCETLLHDLHRHGSELRGHDDSGRLWAVETKGAKRGIALNTATMTGGDALHFLTEARCAGDSGTAWRWAANWLGVLPDRAMRSAEPRAIRPIKPPTTEDGAALIERRRRQALARYLNASPDLEDTPAAAYLAHRLAPAMLPAGRALRYAERSYYSADETLPAMVAPIIEPTSRKFLAAHCTYLSHHDGAWRKTRLAPARKVWGHFRGGVVPLARGKSRKPLGDAPDGDECLIAEGIENTLAAMWLRPELRAFAAIAVGNLPAIALPPAIAGVCLVHDRDGENDGPRIARERAVDRWLTEGRAVSFIRPPEGFADVTEYVLDAMRERVG